MVKVFNDGLDKKDKNYKEKGVLKLLEDISDRISKFNNGNKKSNRLDGRENGGSDGDDRGSDGNEEYL